MELPDTALPDTVADVEALDELLSRPTPGVVETLRALRGDVLILGVAGKMGPTLARMAVRAIELAGIGARVIGVSRFSDPAARDRLEAWGVETIACDLMDEAALTDLPDAPNVIYMVGTKFGAAEQQARTALAGPAAVPVRARPRPARSGSCSCRGAAAGPAGNRRRRRRARAGQCGFAR